MLRRLSLPPLIPGVKVGPWRQDDPHRDLADLQFAQVRMRTLQRDGFTCCYCGFRSTPEREAAAHTLRASGYLEVHHQDDDHANNEPGNLVTVCPFCHQVFHVGFAGHRGAIKTIHLPWMKQEDLNLLVNCLATAATRGGEMGEDAQTLMSWLQALEGLAAQEFGEEIMGAGNLGTALMGLHHEGLYAERGKALSNLRLLPVPKMFQQAIEWWSQNTWLPGVRWQSQWQAVYQQWARSSS